MVGRTISHYQITQKLGAGGMGEIYKAQDTRLNRIVAIKVLGSAHAEMQDRRQRFLQEAQAASALNHPNIITIHDIVSSGDSEFMVMECVSGKSLAELIPKGGLPMSLVLDYGVQIAAALEAAHGAGIVHRDLKPGNIMVTDSGLVKVLDFGLAKLLSPMANAAAAGEETRTFQGAPLTVEGSIMGTVSYMSPEQAEGKPVDPRSDIFAFGAMLHEMVTGERAFAGDSTISTLSSILRDETSPLTHSEGVPPALQNVVEKCLRKKREERWQSMQEVRAALMALKRDSESGTLFAAPRPVVRPKSRLPLIAAGVAGLALVLIAVWWFAGRSKPVAPPAPVAVQTPPVTTPPPEVAQAPAPKPVEIAPASPVVPKSRPVQATPQPAAALPVAPPSAPIARTVVVSDAMPVAIELAEDVPANAPAGQALHFIVSREFRIGNNVVLPKGAAVTGEVVEAAHKKLIGSVHMTYRLKDGAVPGGDKLSLRAASSKSEEHRPLEIPGSKHPKETAALAGTAYIAYVDGDQTVSVRK